MADGERCDGSWLKIDSKCCLEHKFIKCNDRPCYNFKGRILELLIIRTII